MTARGGTIQFESCPGMSSTREFQVIRITNERREVEPDCRVWLERAERVFALLPSRLLPALAPQQFNALTESRSKI